MSVDGIKAASAERPFPEVGVRRFGRINWLGVWTLYQKEVMRFVKVGGQTIAAPIANAILFFFIFTQVFGESRANVSASVDYATFIAPGLIMMGIIQNSFANSTSSLMIAKVQGSLVDVLMPPLSPGELTFCFVAGGATRGVVVAILTAIGMSLFGVNILPADFAAAIFFGAGASVLLALVGLLAGIWAEKFDHVATITNFVIIPLSMLSGTFYSISMLGGVWVEISQWNPFFYLIDGFRYGMIGHADGSPAIGVAVVLGLNVVLILIAHRLFTIGYRLKA
jgi:ABC-2 type transport system permease protein